MHAYCPRINQPHCQRYSCGPYVQTYPIPDVAIVHVYLFLLHQHWQNKNLNILAGQIHKTLAYIQFSLWAQLHCILGQWVHYVIRVLEYGCWEGGSHCILSFYSASKNEYTTSLAIYESYPTKNLNILHLIILRVYV